jgi:hypothetical protein
MSYLKKLKEDIENGEIDHVYSKTNRRMVELGLGSGIRAEVIYFTNDDDIGIDNIQSVTLYEHGKATVLDDDDIALFIKAEIL